MRLPANETLLLTGTVDPIDPRAGEPGSPGVSGPACEEHGVPGRAP